MSRSPARRGLALATLGLTVVLGACGASTAASTSSTGKPAGTSGADSTGTPLEQLFTGSTGGQRALEDQIAACMRDRGWQYTPNTAGMTQNVSIGGDRDPKFREQYGYGISTQPPPEAFGGISSTFDPAKDPNAKYVESLSDDDKARYQKDLFGDLAMSGSDGAVAVSADSGPMDGNSCMAKAQVAAAKDHPEMSQEFGKRVGELMQALESDPKMQEATRRWSACMAKADFTYTKVDEIYADLSKRAGDLLGTNAPATSGGDATGGATVIAIGTGPGAGAGPTTTLSAGDQERLTKLQAEERAIAKADDACRKDTVDKVRPELEQEVVDKLRSEFPGVGSGK